MACMSSRWAAKADAWRLSDLSIRSHGLLWRWPCCQCRRQTPGCCWHFRRRQRQVGDLLPHWRAALCWSRSVRSDAFADVPRLLKLPTRRCRLRSASCLSIPGLESWQLGLVADCHRSCTALTPARPPLALLIPTSNTSQGRHSLCMPVNYCTLCTA